MTRFHSNRFILVLAATALASIQFSCGGPAECEVTFNKDSKMLMVHLHPPGETGESRTRGQFNRNRKISREAGGPLKITIESKPDLTVLFPDSGNTYHVTGSIQGEVVNNDLKSLTYDLFATGGVYGETPHRFKRD